MAKSALCLSASSLLARRVFAILHVIAVLRLRARLRQRALPRHRALLGLGARLQLLAAVLGASLLLAHPALADESLAPAEEALAESGGSQKESRSAAQPKRVRAELRAPSGCGSQALLKQSFNQRAHGWELSFEAQPDLLFRVEVVPDGVLAELQILLAEGETLHRQIKADDCEGALSALGFIAAVALDPQAEQPVQLRSKEQTPPPDASSGQSIRLLELGMAAQWRAAPQALLGAAVAFHQMQQHGGWWAPGWSLKLSYLTGPWADYAANRARFDLTQVSADFCPSQLRAANFRAQLCLAAQAGLLRARADADLDSQNALRPWLAGGPALALSYLFSQRIGLFIHGGANFPLLRDSFQFDTQTFHQVARVSPELNAGFSWRFR